MKEARKPKCPADCKGPFENTAASIRVIRKIKRYKNKMTNINMNEHFFYEK